MPNVLAASGYHGRANRAYQKRLIGPKEPEQPHLHGRQHEEYLTARTAQRFWSNDPLGNRLQSW